MKKKTKQIMAAAGAGALLLLGLTYAANDELRIVHYGVTTNKLAEVVRFAVVTDLHSCQYGEGEIELIRAVESQHPEAVFLVGDIFDDSLPHENALTFIQEMAKRYPCFYVSGNHEYWSDEIDSIKEMVREAGVTVLEGETVRLELSGQTINLCGVDDPTYIGIQTMEEQIKTVWTEAESKAGGNIGNEATILLAHRPELVDRYLKYDFDLVLAGHAHGGQWRIPKVLNGLMSPNQGIFPKYAGGRYEFGDQTMIVSRGLARETTWIPRFFNRPELVIIDFC